MGPGRHLRLSWGPELSALLLPFPPQNQSQLRNRQQEDLGTGKARPPHLEGSPEETGHSREFGREREAPRSCSQALLSHGP